MSEYLYTFVASVQLASSLEWIAVAFGLAYIVLATRENPWCWPAAFFGTATSVYLFWDGKLLMESALNVYYLLMALYGAWQWRFGGANNGCLEIQSWQSQQHLFALGLITLATLISGSILTNRTDAALPYLDSFTTWSAVLTTWMVAHKVLENWLYWLVINTASIYLYLERGFVLYAVLYLLYIMIAVVGYREWRRRYHLTLNHD